MVFHRLLSMAATSKRRRLGATLLPRAGLEIGPEAALLDYVLSWIERGGLISYLAKSLQTELGESISRFFLSLIVYRLAPDATVRIATTRRSVSRELLCSQLNAV